MIFIGLANKHELLFLYDSIEYQIFEHYDFVFIRYSIRFITHINMYVEYYIS